MKTEDGFGAVCVAKLSLSFTCRTCLNTDPDQQLISIFEGSESSGKLSLDLFNQLSLLELKIAKDDGYPANICSLCMERLMAVDVFRKQCRKAQDYLEQYFVKLPEDVPDIKPDVLVSIVKDSDILNDSKDVEPKEDGEDEDRNDVGFEGEESSSEYKPEYDESASDNEIEKRKCLVCDKVFKTVAIRNKHLRLHSKGNAVSCDECKISFKCKGNLVKHRKTVHSYGDYTCPVCEKKFTRTSKYEYHLKTHDQERNYKCRHCDKSFVQHSHRKNHELTHTEQGPSSHLCNICGKSFRYGSSLITHLKKHEGKRKYKCDICNKQFAQKGNLKQHLDIHNDTRAYQCDQCGKKFNQKCTLKTHLNLHKAEKTHHCELCNESFLRIRELRRHCLIIHGKTDLSIRVDQSLQENEDTAESVPVKKAEEKPRKNINDYPYGCELCSMTFRVPSALAKHIQGHREERKFNCTECGNLFKTLEALKLHINGVHLKQKPFSCEVCKKSFARVGDRNVHMRSHSDEKPHQCTFCGRGFHLAKALRAHTRQHTGERPFVCIICNAGFTCHKTLVSHTQRQHAEDPQVQRKLEELAQTALRAPSSAVEEGGASTMVTKSET